MDNSELDNIIKEYIDEKYSVEELHRGYAHKKWIITGENETIFLKSFNDISQNRIEFINYIQDYLKLYTPNLIKNKKNCTYTQLNDKTYVAYELLNGKSINKFEISQGIIEKIGTFLGKLHSELNQVILQPYFTEISSLKINENSILKIEKLIRDKKEFKDKDYYEILKAKRKILNKLPIDTLDKANLKLSKQIVHGDFYLDNIIITDNILKITDLDQVCIFYKMYEVIRGMMMIAYDENLNDIDNMSRIKSFILGYQKENSIEDLNLSIDLYLYTLASSMYCLQEKDWNDENKKRFAKTRFNMLKWLYNKKTTLIKNIEREDYER